MTDGHLNVQLPGTACRLIVHADDFGISESVNDGIIDAYCQGILTSTSIIASGIAVNQAISLARATPGLDVGVHLTLVGERPLVPAEEVSSLTDGQGRFLPSAGSFMGRLLRGIISLEEIRRELDAQIAFIVDQGLRVSHLDGHQHLHMAPGIRPIVGQLARKWNVPAIRYPAETPRLYMLRQPSAWGRVAELALLNAFCMLAKNADSVRTEHFVGFFFGGRLSKRNLLTALNSLPREGTCELMCHPGRGASGSAYRAWDYHWQEELDALTSSDVADFLRKRGVALISYRDLPLDGTCR